MHSWDPTTAAPTLSYAGEGLWLAPGQVAETSYPGDGHDWCRAIEDDSFWFQHRNRIIQAAVARFPSPGAIVDVGGGNGCVAAALRQGGVQAVVLEPGPLGVKHAQARGVPVIQGLLTEGLFAGDSVAGIGLFDVLEHLSDDGALLREVARVLVPGGRLYVTVPAHPMLWSAEDEYAQHHRRYTPSRLTRAIGEAGLDRIFVTPFFGCLVAPILVVRAMAGMFGRVRQSRPGDDRAHRLPAGTLGRWLQRALAAEARQVMRGSRCATGASLLLVAEKPTGLAATQELR
jgi:SAM-dependent methyltransferase